MEFGRPDLLPLLWLVPFAVAAGVFAAWRRGVRLRRWADRALWSSLAPQRSRWLRGLRLGLVAAALGFAVVAAARPQVAARLVQVESRGIEVVVLLDTSLSMKATDVVPSRLERCKREIRELFDGLRGDRVGIVIFAGTSFALCPLTSDVAGANLFLDAAEPDVLPDPGTNLEEALNGARELLTSREERTSPGAVVLFSDGETHEGDVKAAVAACREARIPILSVGVGTPMGEPIPIYDDSGKLTGYKKDRSGEVVRSRLDEATLRFLATETGGAYYPATLAGHEVGEILDYLGKLERGELGGSMRRRVEERFQVPAGLSAILLLLAILVPEGKRPVARSAGERG